VARLSTILVEGFRFICEAERVVDDIASRIGIRRRYFSQKGQDRWVIERAAAGQRNGYFVEVGAGDGRTHSNTFVLERDFGWTGLLIEPNPGFADAIRKYRSSELITACADAEKGEKPFLALGYMGGLVGEDTDHAPSRRPATLRRHAAKVLMLPCKPLADILEEAQAPAVIDFLSMDVEGAEYRILKSFPFDRFTFRAITIERPTRKLHALLIEAGYVLDRIKLYDAFYLSRDNARRLQVAGVPFDGMNPKFF
jgi:FkbM family methyltransferase